MLKQPHDTNNELLLAVMHELKFATYYREVNCKPSASWPRPVVLSLADGRVRESLVAWKLFAINLVVRIRTLPDVTGLHTRGPFV